jgi:hypothetical protein
MFWSFKLSFDVDILAFLATFPKIGQHFNQCSGHSGNEQVCEIDIRLFNVCRSTPLTAKLERLTMKIFTAQYDYLSSTN